MRQLCSGRLVARNCSTIARPLAPSLALAELGLEGFFSAPSRPISTVSEGRGGALVFPIAGIARLISASLRHRQNPCFAAEKLGFSKRIGASSAEQKCKNRRNLEPSHFTRTALFAQAKSGRPRYGKIFIFSRLNRLGWAWSCALGPTRGRGKRRLKIAARPRANRHDFKFAWALRRNDSGWIRRLRDEAGQQIVHLLAQN
jgi:hypothetical protein